MIPSQATLGVGRVWRPIMGFCTTVVAVLASVASDIGPKNTQVSITSQPVTFSQSSLEQHLQFRVKSENPRYSLTVSIATNQDVTPVLDLGVMDSSPSGATLSSHSETNGTRNTTLWSQVTAGCAQAFPCVVDFDLSALAQAPPTTPSSGTLYVSGTLESDLNTQSYLSIEPL